jgi:membrane protein DedA with SNARE-associated domain
VFEVPLIPYTLLTLIGSAIWAFAFAGAGYGLGSSYERFHHDFRYVEYAVVAGVVAVAAYLVYRVFKAATVRRRDDPAR